MPSLKNRSIRVALSPSCNLNCVYCDGPQGREPDKHGAMEDFRSKPLSSGVIEAETYIKIIKALYLSGFTGVTFTGGEPFLNPDLDVIINKVKDLGISNVGITTNGMMLDGYIQRNGHLPSGLTLLTISLDTIDPVEFRKITRNGNFKKIVKGLKAVKKNNPLLTIRANKVILRSTINSLPGYIEFCENNNINEVNFLNLILKNPHEKSFFEKEFVSSQEVLEYLNAKAKYNFILDDKYEFQTILPSGLRIILKDTNQTLRNSLCNKCPIYCQEGYFTVRVATDGTISTCPDYNNKLPYIDGPLELKNGVLQQKMGYLARVLISTEMENTLEAFFEKKGISLK